MKRVKALLAITPIAMMPIAALAGFTTPPRGSVPEPETLALIGIGVVALIIAKTRKRK